MYYEKMITYSGERKRNILAIIIIIIVYMY